MNSLYTPASSFLSNSCEPGRSVPCWRRTRNWHQQWTSRRKGAQGEPAIPSQPSPSPTSLSQLHQGMLQPATPTCSGESCACHSALDLLTLNCSDILGVVEKREKGKTAAAV